MRGTIQVLSPAVAERIAAGEVIERPASVVKELVENSIDAGARDISIRLEDGGKQLIEITDNGHGMGPEDLGLSIRRHATSKLRSLGDLERILTLGFRGEALASVSAVTDFTVLSREEGAETTYRLRGTPSGQQGNAPEKITFGHFLGAPHGTRIEARGLFSQVPARLKFLKSQASEVAHTREWIERVALAHPAIAFELTSADRTVLRLRSETAEERVQAILSDGESHPLVQAESEGGGYKLRLYWLQGLSLPTSRKLLQTVNGRSVRDRLLQQATMSAFRQSLLPGQFPAVALFVDIDPGLIDVNVHPTKTELRFLNSRDIFRSVESLIEASLVKHGAPNYATSQFSGQLSGQFTGQSSAAFSGYSPGSFSGTASGLPLGAPMELSAREASTPELWNTTHPLSQASFLGTLFGTYFVFDDGAEMVLVDQHAAHERVRYEKLKSRVINKPGSVRPESQTLLVPEVVGFPLEHRETVEKRLPLLADLGFDAEIFGDDKLLIRSIPAEWGGRELVTRLKGLAEKLISLEGELKSPVESRGLLWDEALFEKLASEACHSAIRAGDRVDTYQALEIVRQLFDCQHPWNCPHGRPTVVRVPQGKLEEWFQRRI